MIVCACPVPTRGAHRDRHGRWERDAMDAVGARDERGRADGEIVWSRRPDAGVKFLARRWREATEANKPGTPGRARISRKTIAQGMPDDVAALLLLACARVHFLCTQG